MRHILITGTSRGIGLEFVAQYGSLHNKVTAVTRGASDELKDYAERHGHVSILEADSTTAEGIQAIAQALGTTPLDLLILNAGIYHILDSEDLNKDIEKWQSSFLLNCIAPIMLARALRSNLEAATQATIVGITSRMGSIADNRSGGGYIYRSSKAAFNAALKSLAQDLKAVEIPVLILHPGWVMTEMGGPHALISPQESVQGMRAMIDQATIDNTGSFYAFDGERLPW
jgi:short-subunit dehydrogenase